MGVVTSCQYDICVKDFIVRVSGNASVLRWDLLRILISTWASFPSGVEAALRASLIWR